MEAPLASNVASHDDDLGVEGLHKADGRGMEIYLVIGVSCEQVK